MGLVHPEVSSVRFSTLIFQVLSSGSTAVTSCPHSVMLRGTFTLAVGLSTTIVSSSPGRSFSKRSLARTKVYGQVSPRKSKVSPDNGPLRFENGV